MTKQGKTIGTMENNSTSKCGNYLPEHGVSVVLEINEGLLKTSKSYEQLVMTWKKGIMEKVEEYRVIQPEDSKDGKRNFEYQGGHTKFGLVG